METKNGKIMKFSEVYGQYLTCGFHQIIRDLRYVSYISRYVWIGPMLELCLCSSSSILLT